MDEAGVHPLLLAIGSERYTPYEDVSRPSELLTIANHILGKGQLSLAKYLWIANKGDQEGLDVNDAPSFFKHMLERIDLSRDIHFYTNTSIDTLDYSGDGLNTGSKVVIAAVGDARRELASDLSGISIPSFVKDARIAGAGILALDIGPHQSDAETKAEVQRLTEAIDPNMSNTIPLIVLVDDAEFVSRNFSNFIWVSFTRSNPASDIHGIKSFTENKHWGCNGPMIIDARVKKHHAPVLDKDPATEKIVDRLGEKGNSLYGII